MNEEHVIKIKEFLLSIAEYIDANELGDNIIYSLSFIGESDKNDGVFHIMQTNAYSLGELNMLYDRGVDSYVRNSGGDNGSKYGDLFDKDIYLN